MRFLRILGWAVFLGASWTWCIGMYLPVLLVRDYGIWAFAVFAVPNVVGAAAMAWVLPDAEASEQFVRRHRSACLWFSVITLAFHAFVLRAFLPESIFYFYRSGNTVPALVLLAVCLTCLLSWKNVFVAPAIALGVSVIAAVTLWRQGQLFNNTGGWYVAPGLNLLWLATACVFGFGLCPYLDLTFHKARQATTPADGKAAFAIGFGVIFLTMIIFSLGYSELSRSPGDTNHIIITELTPDSTVLLLMGHFTVQTVLKFVLHGRAIWAGGIAAYRRAVFALVSVAAFFGWVMPHSVYHGLEIFEVGYRLFLSFYGLFFPAYVWICIFGKKSMRVWLIAVLIAAPMFWMGFIERQMIWLLPGVAVPFIAGLRLFSRARPVPSEPSPS